MKDAAGAVQINGDGDADALLTPAEDASRFPMLAELLAGMDGPRLRTELRELLSPQLRLRAPRRYVRVLCRLHGTGYDEPVLLTDVSASGVRFLVQSDVPLDITKVGNMNLRVRTSAGARELPVALVRRCGGDGRHTDLAFRFLEPSDELGTIIAELRSVIFGDA